MSSNKTNIDVGAKLKTWKSNGSLHTDLQLNHDYAQFKHMYTRVDQQWTIHHLHIELDIFPIETGNISNYHIHLLPEVLLYFKGLNVCKHVQDQTSSSLEKPMSQHLKRIPRMCPSPHFTVVSKREVHHGPLQGAGSPGGCSPSPPRSIVRLGWLPNDDNTMINSYSHG